LTPEDRQHIEPVIVKYTHIFHDEETNDFKGTTVIEHEIPIGDARPIRRPLQNAICTSRGNGTTDSENAPERRHPRE
jgi:hypothetical protein